MKFRIYTIEQRNECLHLLQALKFRWKDGTSPAQKSPFFNEYPHYLIIESNRITICTNDLLYFENSPGVDTTLEQLRELVYKNLHTIKLGDFEYGYLKQVEEKLTSDWQRFHALEAGPKIVGRYNSATFAIRRLMEIYEFPNEFFGEDNE